MGERARAHPRAVRADRGAVLRSCGRDGQVPDAGHGRHPRASGLRALAATRGASGQLNVGGAPANPLILPHYSRAFTVGCWRVAIPLTIGSVYPHPLPLSDGDQTLSVELREGRGRRGAARHGRGPARREGQRAEYRCVGCGYGLVVHGQPPSCPMCRQARWENAEWRPFSQLPDFPSAPAALKDDSTSLPSPTAG